MTFKNSAQMSENIHRSSMVGMAGGGYVVSQVSMGLAKIGGQSIGSLLNFLCGRDYYIFLLVGTIIGVYAAFPAYWLFAENPYYYVNRFIFLLIAQTLVAKGFWQIAMRRELSRTFEPLYARQLISRNFWAYFFYPLGIGFLYWGADKLVSKGYLPIDGSTVMLFFLLLTLWFYRWSIERICLHRIARGYARAGLDQPEIAQLLPVLQNQVNRRRYFHEISAAIIVFGLPSLIQFVAGTPIRYSF